MTLCQWQQHGQLQSAQWPDSLQHAAPQWLEVIGDQTSADTAFRLASEGAGLVYDGDFHNARQLLQAMARRLDKKPIKPADTLLQTFHLYRARQIQRAHLLNKLLLPLHQGNCLLKRAPSTVDAVQHALGQVPEALLLPMQMLQGMVGAYQWWLKGVPIPALGQSIHPAYGVYSPVRGEYLDLIASAPLTASSALDIGTGSGVIAALLARRGVAQVTATDNQPRALACAQDNLQRLGLAAQVTVLEADLFPQHLKVDLAVCNPPWLPAKANTPLEHAVYDPDSRMLRAFLNRVPQHLTANGEAWLVMSDFAELIGLRPPGQLAGWLSEAGLTLVERHTIAPRHGRARDPNDVLFAARARETTSLYRLKCLPNAANLAP